MLLIWHRKRQQQQTFFFFLQVFTFLYVYIPKQKKKNFFLPYSFEQSFIRSFVQFLRSFICSVHEEIISSFFFLLWLTQYASVIICSEIQNKNNFLFFPLLVFWYIYNTVDTGREQAVSVVGLSSLSITYNLLYHLIQQSTLRKS